MSKSIKFSIAAFFAVSAFSIHAQNYATGTSTNANAQDSTGIVSSGGYVNEGYQPVPSQNQPCAATNASWSGNGATCAAAIPSTASGSIAGASSSNGNTGTAQYSCSNGVYTGISSTCAPAASAPSPTPTPVAASCPAKKFLPIQGSLGGGACRPPQSYGLTVPMLSDKQIYQGTGSYAGSLFQCNNGTTGYVSGNSICQVK